MVPRDCIEVVNYLHDKQSNVEREKKRVVDVDLSPYGFVLRSLLQLLHVQCGNGLNNARMAFRFGIRRVAYEGPMYQSMIVQRNGRDAEKYVKEVRKQDGKRNSEDAQSGQQPCKPCLHGCQLGQSAPRSLVLFHVVAPELTRD